MTATPVYLSLGAGVQSTTLALMAAAGELQPMPAAAVFADTQREPAAVYQHLDRLAAALPFPVIRVSAGDLRAAALRGESVRGHRFAAIPWHIRNPDGSAAMGARQCTAEYKIMPVRRACRQQMQAAGARRLVLWLGISTDEAHRMKDSDRKYIAHQYPLIDRRMNRHDCQRWLAAHGWTAPKSACLGCPFHGDAFWRALRDTAPAEWADAVAMDEAIRQQPGMRGEQYVHRSLQPLARVDLSTDTDRGQLSLWGNECSGMCGV